MLATTTSAATLGWWIYLPAPHRQRAKPVEEHFHVDQSPFRRAPHEAEMQSGAATSQRDATVDVNNPHGFYQSQAHAVPGLKGFRSANENAPDDIRGGALIMAATHGQLEMVRFLVEQCGVAVNCKDHEGNSALMKAAETGHVDVVQYLVQRCGADANVENKDGKTAVRLAADHGHHDIQRLLTPCISLSPTQPHRGHDNSVRERLYRWVTSLRAKLLAAKVLHQWPRMRLRRLCVGDASEMAETVVSPSVHSPSSSIPPSEIELTRFTQSHHIGGDFQAKWLDADAVVKLFIPDAAHSSFNDEVSLWQRLRHPNVIKMYGACEAGPGLQFFVCEYASNGSLLEHGTSSSAERPATMWKYLLEAALGLEYLHERGIVHGDLRCCNILVGSDDIAKLSNFALSGQKKRSSTNTSDVVGSMRWQAPEVLEGMAPSFESDVYSLGMCILEAATGKQPWGDTDHWAVRHFKGEWAPEKGVEAWYTPKCPHRTARALVWRMCCKAPRKRVKLSSVVCELERLAMEESSEPSQPELDSADPFGDLKNGQMQEAWLRLQASMEKNGTAQYYGAFNGLKTIQKCLQVSSHHQHGVFARFHALLVEFVQVVTMEPEQALVLRLSSTRATSSSFYAIQRRVESLMVTLGLKDSVDAATPGTEAQWQHQQNEFVVSGISDTRLLLRSLKTVEERLALLRRLRAAIESPLGTYTADQLQVMRKAYEDISSEVDTKETSKLAPDWFIPWYELVIDEASCLGEGGFGSVYRAKWLDSNVVVKRVTLAGSGGKADPSTTFCSSLLASDDPSTTQAEPNAANTAEAVAMFRCEVDIWFRFSHPHVVRLFGACHVDRPFFVCEYATNGTLVSYLRKHPDELWSKLHEAALGVQYLHARDVVHGDLKGNNIVVGSDLKAKVTDFGLSSTANSNAEVLVSGAVHWVAPELLDGSKVPTFASDVYSLGMCIVEALRVVEAVASGKDSSYCLPWRVGDRIAVRYHATHGELPSRPRICEDDQWGLIQRMCALEPEERIKISTVVDELAVAAGMGVQSSGVAAAKWESIPEVVAEMQQLLLSLQEDGDQPDATISLYVSLWGSLGQIHKRTDDSQGDSCLSAFCSLVAASRESTAQLQNRKGDIVALAETRMRCYALQRRLKKFCEAYFLVCGRRI